MLFAVDSHAALRDNKEVFNPVINSFDVGDIAIDDCTDDRRGPTNGKGAKEQGATAFTFLEVLGVGEIGLSEIDAIDQR